MDENTANETNPQQFETSPDSMPEPVPVEGTTQLTEVSQNGEEDVGNQRLTIIAVVLVLIILIALTIGAVILMLSHPAETETLRDIMIIFVALEMSVLGIVLIILILQVAQLSALLQNEIKPMLEATNETLNTLRGTSAFMSDHLTQPVIQVSGYASAVRRAVDLIRPKPKPKK